MDEYKVLDRTESFVESFFSDLCTFSFLCFSIWLSHGSTWWTFVTGLMFLVFGLGKIATMFKIKVKAFTTKQELIDWANSLDWEK